MLLKILLVFSIILQLYAAVVSIRLMKVTKFNVSWILMSIALVSIAMFRVVEFIRVIWDKELNVPGEIFVWLGVISSICFATGIFFIKKILNYIALNEKKRRLTEERILNTIINTEECERTRFSKDIHDGIGPLLSSVKMSVSALEQMQPRQDQKEIISNINIVLIEAIRSLKEISNNLSPHILQNFGISRAITNFINKLPQNCDTKILFTSNLKNERFENNIEIILYRVICELINNSLKHANATLIKIDMRLNNDDILINFEDNGIGFNYHKNSKHMDGMGLSNIVSRIESLKGNIVFGKKQHDSGVKVFVKVKVFNK